MMKVEKNEKISEGREWMNRKRKSVKWKMEKNVEETNKNKVKNWMKEKKK